MRPISDEKSHCFKHAHTYPREEGACPYCKLAQDAPPAGQTDCTNTKPCDLPNIQCQAPNCNYGRRNDPTFPPTAQNAAKDEGRDILEQARKMLRESLSLRNLGYNESFAMMNAGGVDETGCGPQEYKIAADDLDREITATVSRISAHLAAQPTEEKK